MMDRGGYWSGTHIRNHMMLEPGPYIHREPKRWGEVLAQAAAAIAAVVIGAAVLVISAQMSLM